MPRPKKEIKAVDASADYFEPLFRGRFVRAMQALQKQVSIHELAMSMGNLKQAQRLIPQSKIIEALAPTKKVMKDAFMRGGKLGAEHVKSMYGEEFMSRRAFRAWLASL